MRKNLLEGAKSGTLLTIDITLLEGAKVPLACSAPMSAHRKVRNFRSASTRLSLPTVPRQTINTANDNYGETTESIMDIDERIAPA